MTTIHDHKQPVVQPMLPKAGRAAIYTRVAARANQQTTQPQSNDLLAFALEHGYEGEQVTIFEDRATSGKAAIVRREAFTALLTAITQPQPDQEPIRAIFASSEDRLFRDANAGDIALFIETCASHGVALYTPTAEYDFTNRAHVAQFRFLCETAYQYVAQMITSRLQAGRRAAQRRKEADN